MELTDSTDSEPLIALSMMSVTSLSTASGDAPGYVGGDDSLRQFESWEEFPLQLGCCNETEHNRNHGDQSDEGTVLQAQASQCFHAAILFDGPCEHPEVNPRSASGQPPVSGEENLRKNLAAPAS